MLHRTLAAALPLVLASALARPARADDTAEATRAAANALFDEGKRLVAAGRHPEACERLDASLAMLPRLGVRLNLADCLERIGRTASAWALFADAAAEAQRLADPREVFARERIAALEPRLTRLAIDVTANRELDGLEVRRDDAFVPAALHGIELPVDPGEHAVEVSAPGRRTWSTLVTVTADGATTRIHVPQLELIAPAAPPPPRAPRLAATPIARVRAAPTSSHRRTLTWAATGIGAAGCTVGVVYGILAYVRWQGAKDACADGFCPRDEHDDARVARGFGTVSTVAFGVGGAALAASIALYLTDDERRSRDGALRVVPAASSSSLTLLLDGRF